MQDWEKIIDVLSEEAKKQKISTYKLAENVGMCQNNIWRIFNKEHAPGIKVLIKIAYALDFDILLKKR